MAVSPVTSYDDLVALFSSNQFGPPLVLGPVNWADQTSVTNAVGRKMGRDGRLWVFYADGDPGDVQPLINPGSFAAALTDGHDPASLGIDLRFFQLDADQDAAFRSLVPARPRLRK
jgi:hypothetical protein